MHIRYLRAKNFLCFGPEPIEVDFTQLGNIVTITGQNRDYSDQHSNGSGKSSLIQAIVYGLFGTLIKGLNHKDAINVQAGKGLETEVHFDNYRVLRRRKPDRLQLFEGNEDISVGGIPTTDQAIQNRIHLSAEAFTNLVCFGQHNERGFLRCKPEEKRRIAENLLSLDKYVKYHESAKKLRNACHNQLEQLSISYNHVLQSISQTERRLQVVSQQQSQWEERRQNDCLLLSQRIADKQVALKKSDDGQLLVAYDTAQKELQQIVHYLAECDRKKIALASELQEASQQLQQQLMHQAEQTSQVADLNRRLSFVGEQIAKIQKSKNLRSGEPCPYCEQVIQEDHLSKIEERQMAQVLALEDQQRQLRQEGEQAAEQLRVCGQKAKACQQRQALVQSREQQIANAIQTLLGKQRKLSSVPKPELSSQGLLLETEIQHLEERKASREAEVNPHNVVVQTVQAELVEIQNQARQTRRDMQQFEKKLPYLDFWVKGFGDEGIRSFVIQEVIPILNGRINYWLQYLLDNDLSLDFDNQLEPRITRPGSKSRFLYAHLSGGEHQRIDLAISLAFAYVTTMTSGACPSLLCLDEVGTNCDRPGIHAIYRVICELARSRQVLVTTHHPELLELLEPHDRLHLVMANGLTRIERHSTK